MSLTNFFVKFKPKMTVENKMKQISIENENIQAISQRESLNLRNFQNANLTNCSDVSNSS
jgi:hypothetical protein